MRILKVLTMAVALISSSAGFAQLKDGEKIIFLGDSITQAGAAENGYVTLFRKSIEHRRPGSGIQVIGAGISGNKVPNLEERLDRDVLAHKPNVVVIYIGINDVWHSTQGKGTPAAQYEKGLTSIVDRCKTAGARVILATPSVVGEKTDGSNQLDTMLDEYSDISRKVAASTGATLLDLRAAFLTHLKSYNIAGETQGILTSDGVHLNDEGNRFVAVRMLEAAGEVATKKPVLRHMVLFKYKPDLTAKQIDEINMAFHQLKHQISEISAFERGTNNSPEGLDKGFTHGYLVTFENEDARAAYLPHEAHTKFVQLIGGKIDDVMVFDYWTIE